MRHLACAIPLAIVSCTESELPTRVEGPVPLSAVAFDRLSLQPTTGQSLSASAIPVSFTADVYFQRTESDVARASSAPLRLRVYSLTVKPETTTTITPLSALLADSAMVSGPTGSHRFSGSATVAGLTQRCVPYTFVALYASLPDAADPTKTSAGAWASYPVTGVNTTASCVFGGGSGFLAARSGFFAPFGLPGEPFRIAGRNLRVSASNAVALSAVTGTVNASLASIVGQDTLFGSNYDYFLGWIPAGARTGPIRVTTASGEALYGSGQSLTATISTSVNDYYEPNNTPDSASSALLSAIEKAYAGVFLQFNPALTMTGADRQLNLYGFATVGRGDWFRLAIPSSGDVCVSVRPTATDDIDVYVFTSQLGQFVARSTNGPGSAEFIRLTNQPAGTTLFVWVTPFDIKSTSGSYSYAAGSCTSVGTLSVSVPTGGRNPEDRILPPQTQSLVRRAP